MIPVIRNSSSIESLEVSPVGLTVDCTFKNGNSYHYENVSQSAINDVLTNENVSLGKFINNSCINNRQVSVTQTLAESEATSWA